jgi:hypothetical protein
VQIPTQPAALPPEVSGLGTKGVMPALIRPASARRSIKEAKESGQSMLAARGWRALQGVTGSPLFKASRHHPDGLPGLSLGHDAECKC